MLSVEACPTLNLPRKLTDWLRWMVTAQQFVEKVGRGLLYAVSLAKRASRTAENAENSDRHVFALALPTLPYENLAKLSGTWKALVL